MLYARDVIRFEGGTPRKLPQTVATIDASLEGVESFRARRLAWCVRQAVAVGDLRPCEVLRSVGLPMSWLPSAREALLAAQLRQRAVA